MGDASCSFRSLQSCGSQTMMLIFLLSGESPRIQHSERTTQNPTGVSINRVFLLCSFLLCFGQCFIVDYFRSAQQLCSSRGSVFTGGVMYQIQVKYGRLPSHWVVVWSACRILYHRLWMPLAPESIWNSCCGWDLGFSGYLVIVACGALSATCNWGFRHFGFE